MKQVREQYPGIKILVHPECMMQVVDAAGRRGIDRVHPPDDRRRAEWLAVGGRYGASPGQSPGPGTPRTSWSNSSRRWSWHVRDDVPDRPAAPATWAVENLAAQGTPVNVVKVPDDTAHWAAGRAAEAHAGSPLTGPLPSLPRESADADARRTDRPRILALREVRHAEPRDGLSQRLRRLRLPSGRRPASSPRSTASHRPGLPGGEGCGRRGCWRPWRATGSS